MSFLLRRAACLCSGLRWPQPAPFARPTRAESCSIYAVFDGHGQKGHDVSNFVKDALPKLIIKEPVARRFALRRMYTVERGWGLPGVMMVASLEKAGCGRHSKATRKLLATRPEM